MKAVILGRKEQRAGPARLVSIGARGFAQTNFKIEMNFKFAISVSLFHLWISLKNL